MATPTSAVYLPLLRVAFPRARFVHLTRNPLDQIASAKEYLTWVDNDSSFAIGRRLVMTRPLVALAAVGGRWFHRWRWIRFAHEGFLVVRPKGFQQASQYPKLEFLCWYLATIEAQIQEVLSDLPATRKHSCRYESLVGDSGEIERLAQFLNIELSSEFVGSFRNATHTRGLDRHEKSLSESETTIVECYLANSDLGLLKKTS